MPVEGNKRPPRIPRTPEEVEELILKKKIREHKKLQRFKASTLYKCFNIFNIICFFIYCELIMCFLGPSHYQTHYSRNVSAEHGIEKNKYGDRILAAVKITGINGKKYRFAVNEFIEVPEKFSRFNIGKDFLLHKEIKGTITTSGKVFWIYESVSIFFLAIFVAVFSCIIFIYNLNENIYPLTAITIINTVTVWAFTAF
jgi:hypothetical protein